MKEARKEMAQRRRRIIYNDDGCYARPFDTPEKFYKARLQQTVNTQVDTVFYCTGETTLFTHLSEVGETYGEFISDDDEAYALNLRNGIRALKKTGRETLRLANEFCQRNDIEFFFSLRMNDTHDTYTWGDWMLSRWKREHPEHLIGEVADRDKYPNSSPRFHWSSLDYELPEVREYIFRILEDVCQRYDVDGIELDWFRSPMFFRPTLDLEPVEPEHVTIMNDFVRRVRRMTEKISQRRGRPLLVAARVPMSVNRCLAIGLDVVTWLRDDLCDILSVGGGYVPMAMGQSVREMADFAHQYGVPVYACVSASGMRGEAASYGSGHASVEAWRGAAMNVWHAGGDGVYTFNFFPAQRDERLSQLGSPETLKGLDKIYGIDYIVVETFEGDLRPGLVVPNRLPVELQMDGWSPVHLPVGEDIVANAPQGKAAHTRLRLRLSTIAQGDEVSAKLNGEALGVATPTEPLSSEPATAWVELELNPEVVGEGENLVEVELTAQRAIEEPVVLDRLDLTVRYK